MIGNSAALAKSMLKSWRLSLILGSLQALQSRDGLCGLMNPARAFLLPEFLREKATLGR
jgi:hypothetical protein